MTTLKRIAVALFLAASLFAAFARDVPSVARAQSVPLGGPTAFRVASPGSDALALEWRDNAAAELGYVIWRWQDLTGWTFVADLPTGAQSYTDSGLMPGLLYWYYLAAYDYYQYSTWAYVSATPVALPTVVYPTWWSRAQQNGCTDKPDVRFGSPPMAIENIVNIAPYGLMVASHVIPSDHQGYHFPERTAVPRYDVLSVADGEITHITVRNVSVDTGRPSAAQYHITIRHSCSIVTQYDLIDELAPDIAARFDSLRSGSAVYPVKEGQVLGRAGSTAGGIDLWVADLRTLAPGYIVPQHYEAEAWRLYAVEPFSLYSEPLRSQLRARSIRRVEPRGGRADTDIDGRLIGGWFVENTNGYGGLDQSMFFRTHLAVTYHPYDGATAIISMGDFNGRALQYGVRGNTPDPAQVTPATGIVKYELMLYGYYDGATGRAWDYKAPLENLRLQPINNETHGTVLFQMLSDRKMKFEAFPGKRSSEVTSFTANSIVYER